MAKIVCIEDEPDIRKDIAETLELAGHTVIEAENGALGLKAILRERPDLAISDITMPVLDGLGLLGALRAKHPEFDDMPFLFLSALADRKDQIAGCEMGADEYLTKPVDFELLNVVVNAKLRQVRRMQENKDRQLLKIYGALTKTPIPEAPLSLGTHAIGARMNIVYLSNDEADFSGIIDALQARGHRLHTQQSGRKFLESVDSLMPDLLLLEFNTRDLQAPMLIKMLQSQGKYTFPKILILPAKAPDFPALRKLPLFDAHFHAPVDCQILMEQIDNLSLSLKYSEDLLAAG